MNERRTFAVQSLLAVLLFNLALLATVLYFAGHPLLRGDAPDSQTLLLLAAALVIMLLLWVVLQWLGRRAMDRTEARLLANTAAPAPSPAKASPPASPVVVTKPATPSYAAAIQMLAILQREGRLVDFLQEDLALYQDEQIGAAVRSVHAGCKKVLVEHVELAPVYDQAEGATVSVAAGFDANVVRLSGNIVGNPPFTGVLRHRGWRVTKIDLPQQMRSASDDKIVAAAEVEIT